MVLKVMYVCIQNCLVSFQAVLEKLSDLKNDIKN